jgi:hypothetical protein
MADALTDCRIGRILEKLIDVAVIKTAVIIAFLKKQDKPSKIDAPRCLWERLDYRFSDHISKADHYGAHMIGTDGKMVWRTGGMEPDLAR